MAKYDISHSGIQPSIPLVNIVGDLI
jgi:hypothetical protein